MYAHSKAEKSPQLNNLSKGHSQLVNYKLIVEKGHPSS